ncbi:winged helix-turn-helix domain-containing protein [Klebsiella aerogenes]|uniref:winged helix-turn-helix domain-containing protein n=1 Tax=Klebsiella aerogenes TaxID=548 RepID=UPI002549F8D7|nr:helix-turn-helix domain-containing protein [Klebsiella aerogenes]EKZ5287321.1 winged helix-turn-helix domain-containing protein [Klebsiella aerogenes]MDK7100999.1 helix-turn-helix domain-containing protein [Klebsiella aerogenes]MDK7645830.1 helix-turn-helix domain-containing protein [Klebsiella aerogenes]MDK7850932.1 helix-turn-helix domain-containing protein [Klebsiella aerogenes]
MDSGLYLINKLVTFDVEAMVLTNISSKDTVNLTRNLSECLFILLNNQGKIISQDFFIEEVWAKKRMFISENTLVQNIRKLRAFIDSIGLSKEFIVTKKGMGYYFTSEVEVEFIENENERERNKNRAAKLNNILLLFFKLKQVKSAIIVCAFIMLFVFIAGREGAKFYLANLIPTVNYYFSTRIDQCRFYFDNKLGFDKANILKAIVKQNKISCFRASYIYVTYYPLSAHYSYIKCDQRIDSNSENKTCTSVVRYDYAKNI